MTRAASASPPIVGRPAAPASNTDIAKSKPVFHGESPPDQAVIAERIDHRLAGWSAASKKGWRSRKKMAEARTRAEYTEAAAEHRALLERAE